MRTPRGALFLTAITLTAFTATAAPIAKLEAPRGALADADCGLEPPGSPDWGPVPRRPREHRLRPAEGTLPLVRPERAALQGLWDRAGGAPFLGGKTVYLSPGHGFTMTQFGWRAQRGNTNGIVEDLVSAEAVHQYLARYLRNAGARVVTVREGDLNERLVVADEDDPRAYREEGDPGRFAASPEAGWGAYGAKLDNDQNPFTRGKSRTLRTAKSADARAVYLFDVPESGNYHVYISYTQGQDRPADAHYVVRHPGGESHFRVDQRRHGGTWVFLGRFYFERGQSADRGAVVLHNDSQQAGAVLGIDAVRIGGGRGDIDRGMGVSTRPRWEESARYYAQWSGAPAAVWDQANLDDHSDDVGTRSRYAAWDHEDGEDAVYLAWHTNAPDPGVGTSSYVYGPNPPDGTYDFQGVPGSDVLMRLVHDEIVGDIRRGWDSAWRDRGKYSAYFGEVNPRHNPETPAALFEVAFHSTPSDAQQLKQAEFRRLVARAMYQGVARFFAQKDQKAPQLLPEPPTALCARGTGPGEVTVTFQPPAPGPAGLYGDAPSGYRLYRSRDGRSFDEGTAVSGSPVRLRDLPKGAPLYLRLTAVNSGGESLESALLAVRPARDGAPARVLLVNGFDRLDGGLMPRQDLKAFDLGEVQRMLLERMNDQGYLAAHARALDPSATAFDACDHQAVALGEVRLQDYALLDWAAGEQSTRPAVLPEAERRLLAAHLAAGGRLILSGAEAFYALVEKGDEQSRAFAAALGVVYKEDDGAAYRAAAEPGGLFEGLPELTFDDGSHGGYDVDYPDVLDAAAGAQVALRYPSGGGAAILSGGGRPSVAAFGFPLEAVYDDAARAELLARLLRAMAVPADGPAGPGGPADMGNQDDMTSDNNEQIGLAGGGCQAAGGARPAFSGAAFLSIFFLQAWRRRRRGGAGA